MGYKRNKVFVLVFEEREYEGLEIKARGTSVAGVLSVLDLGILFEGDRNALDLSKIKEVEKLFRAFAGCPVDCDRTHVELEEYGLKHYENRILSWNLEDAGDVPVPANYQGLMTQDFDFAQDIALAWLNGILGTPGPLDESSNGGGPSGAGSIPMETL